MITMPFGYVLKPIQERDLKVTFEMALYITKVDTDRRKIETELLKSEQRFRMVFNQQFQFMAILSPEGIVLEISELPLKLQGVKQEDAVGKPFWLLPSWLRIPEWIPRIKANVEKAAQMDEALLTVDEYTLEDGSVQIAEAAYKGIRDSEGTLNYILVQANDITDQKKAEAAIRESEEKHRTLFETMTQGVVYQNAEGIITDANPAAERVPCYRFITTNSRNMISSGSKLLPRSITSSKEVLGNIYGTFAFYKTNNICNCIFGRY